MAEGLLEVQGLERRFTLGGTWLSRRRRVIHAVDGVSFVIEHGEVLGLVGESGCGKSTTGRLILRLIEPSAGSIRFEGHDLLALSPSRLWATRQRMQIVFQDPYASLNPRMRVGRIIAEPLAIYHRAGPAGGASRWPSCWKWWDSIPRSPSAIPTSCRAVNASGSGSPPRSRFGRA